MALSTSLVRQIIFLDVKKREYLPKIDHLIPGDFTVYVEASVTLLDFWVQPEYFKIYLEISKLF